MDLFACLEDAELVWGTLSRLEGLLELQCYCNWIWRFFVGGRFIGKIGSEDVIVDCIAELGGNV